MSRISPEAYVAAFRPELEHHRRFLLAALQHLERCDPAALQAGGALRQLWTTRSIPPLLTQAQAIAIFDRGPTMRQLEDLNETMQAYGITTANRARHFLAQVCHESGGLRWFTELADGSAYEPPSDLAADLGNTQKGDGPRFKGGGAGHLTGRHNYQRFADHVGDQRVMEGCSYVAERYPFRSFGFWWQDNDMNDLVDAGATCRKVSRYVNGKDPANGLAEREAAFARATKAIPST